MNSVTGKDPTAEQLRAQIEELRVENRNIRERLEESEETLRAIHSGEVDAILVTTDGGEQVFTLKGADEPYRLLFEQMNEGALTISEDGSILYCNQSFARTVRRPLESVMGTNLESYVRPPDREKFRQLLELSVARSVRGNISFMTLDGLVVPIHLSISQLPRAKPPTYCIIAADLTELVRAEDALKKSQRRTGAEGSGPDGRPGERA